MGGCSNGNFGFNKTGSGVFSGAISLDNNGGFSMLYYHFAPLKIEVYCKVHLRLKGDSKTYQFRIKGNKADRHSYITLLNTSNDWETIDITINTVYSAFRGKTLDLPNFPGIQMETIAFLIGNKKD